MTEDLVSTARRIIDSNSYLTMATADPEGRPWAAPVWFACEGYTDFFWLSRVTTRHSVNVAGRPEVGIVVFDSTVPMGQGQAVYVEAVAGPVPDDEVESALAVYSARSVASGGRPWQMADVAPPAEFRLYRARATAHYVLDDHDSRVEVYPAHR
ncbi:pyridoxamine 5'-phosphate oxidase family protein [Actinoplanes subglobosus]|uniref:Pyridoxamine 5'-phosphate oxidase family protein n=1 Tax=Actinoplanes subglobosus TaxID=1547892 RepID=A0ABV8IYZ2_9ACTN